MTALDPYGRVDLHELTDDLVYEFLDVPTEALVHYLRRAAITMCRDGDLVTQRVRIRTQANVPNYALEPADEDELVALLDVKCKAEGQAQIIVRTLREPSRRVFGPVAWFAPPEELFIVAPFEGEYEALFSVAPRRDACSVPAELRDRWYEILLTGARHYIHDASGKPWSDKKLSLQLGDEFKNGIRKAKVESMTGYQRGFLRINRPRVL
jgi:hypothetical protein